MEERNVADSGIVPTHQPCAGAGGTETEELVNNRLSTIRTNKSEHMSAHACASRAEYAERRKGDV
jgi:hypothetical protein